MLKILLKNRLRAIFASATRGKPLLYGFLYLYIVGVFAFLFWGLFSQLLVFAELGLGWLYFALAGIVAFALCFMGSVFAAQSQLYDAKDNELLLAMPVPPQAILASRMLLLFGTSLVFCLIVMLPAGVVWCGSYAPSAAQLICFAAFAFVLLPLLSLAVTSAAAWVTALISAHTKRKKLFTMLLSLGFIAAYLYVYANINRYISQLVENGAAVAEAIERAVAPAYWLGVSLAEGSAAGLGLFAALSLGLFALVYTALSRSFIRVTTTKRTSAKSVYRRRQLRVSSRARALVVQELRRFVSSPAYMLNAGMGVLFCIIAAGYLAIRGGSLEKTLELLPGFAENKTAVFAAVLCLVGGFNIVSASSVSLEGRCLWILRSMPVAARDVLVAKARAHIIVSLPPTLLLGCVAAAVFGLGAAQAASVLVSAAVFCLLQAYLGVCVNLHFARFDWDNEVQVIKQSVSVLIAMFAPMLLCGALVALYIAAVRHVLPSDSFVLAAVVLLALLSLALRRYITGRGAELFDGFEA